MDWWEFVWRVYPYKQYCVWVRVRLIVLNQESLSVNHFTISPLQYFTIGIFHHSKYTCYQVVGVIEMLILFYDFWISTYVLTNKKLFGGSHDSRMNYTITTSIYLCYIDTRKQMYTSTIGCHCCACVHPRCWISGSVVSKQFIKPTFSPRWPHVSITLIVECCDAASFWHCAIARRPP